MSTMPSRKRGRTHNGAPRKQFNLRLDSDLMEKLRAFAEGARPVASMPSHVEEAIKCYLEQHEVNRMDGNAPRNA